MIVSKKNMQVPEDWMAVILGFIIIIFSFLGIKSPNLVFNWSSTNELMTTILSGENLWRICSQFIFVWTVGVVGILFTGKSVKYFLFGFPVVYALTLIALLVAGNSYSRSLNLEAVIFSLTFGLLVSNFFKLPQWFREALSTELFVKIGLVLLGTSVIFGDILKAGSLGLVQALIVVLAVWYFAFWLCKKLKVDKELTMMIASAVSICGVSAAIATAGAIKGDSKKLTYVIALVLITAIPMMIGMPWVANWLGLSQQVAGAWLGGTIDTTGAVVASGSLVGEEALKISTIVKFSQNVLLGLAAFGISLYWTYTNNESPETQNNKPGLGVIWDRFPKFVLGFVAASVLFSFFINPSTTTEVKDSLKNIQTLWFALAFTSIGLETNFSELAKYNSRNSLVGFLAAQIFNVIITLAIAYVLFR
jgi:uncharacterized integral membrane protein (TIGR00698 family)